VRFAVAPDRSSPKCRPADASPDGFSVRAAPSDANEMAAFQDIAQARPIIRHFGQKILPI